MRTITPRWAIERKYANNDRELLQIVEVYAPGENKEVVKRENQQWTYQKKLVLLEKEDVS